jgi:hypothetical protein
MAEEGVDGFIEVAARLWRFQRAAVDALAKPALSPSGLPPSQIPFRAHVIPSSQLRPQAYLSILPGRYQNVDS